jgi:hypothetical protein
MTRHDQVRAWRGFREDIEVAQHCVKFFDKAFETTSNRACPEAWFGVHSRCISLTLDRLRLAAVRRNGGVWLLVDRDWQVPVRIRNTPLGWWTGMWGDLDKCTRRADLWRNYFYAGEIILNTPSASPSPITVVQNKNKLPFLLSREVER